MTDAKARLLNQVAARTATAKRHADAAAKELAARDQDGLRAKRAGASYRDLQQATGLTRIAVYKMLERANGGPLSSDSSTEQH